MAGRAKSTKAPKPRNPVARSPLLGKGGAHGKTTAAKRRQANARLADEVAAQLITQLTNNKHDPDTSG